MIDPIVLIVAGNPDEAFIFARDMLGLKQGEWKYVSHFREVSMVRRASVYIVGTGKDRPDFPSIEGLFYMFNHSVVDTNE